MFHVSRRCVSLILNVITSLSFTFFLFLYSSIASAHSKESSILHTVFGENLTHWLISHQGLAIVLLLLTAVFLVYFFMIHQVAKKETKVTIHK